jgi:hypothetical protein
MSEYRAGVRHLPAREIPIPTSVSEIAQAVMAAAPPPSPAGCPVLRRMRAETLADSDVVGFLNTAAVCCWQDLSDQAASPGPAARERVFLGVEIKPPQAADDEIGRAHV